MVNFRSERQLRGLEWVVGREMDVQEEDSTGVSRIFRAHNRGLPVELIVLVGWAS